MQLIQGDLNIFCEMLLTDSVYEDNTEVKQALMSATTELSPLKCYSHSNIFDKKLKK